jgi:hypothetical protein
MYPAAVFQVLHVTAALTPGRLPAKTFRTQLANHSEDQRRRANRSPQNPMPTNQSVVALQMHGIIIHNRLGSIRPNKSPRAQKCTGQSTDILLYTTSGSSAHVHLWLSLGLATDAQNTYRNAKLAHVRVLAVKQKTTIQWQRPLQSLVVGILLE